MKNWSVEHTREVKKWLDIDTYRGFEELPLIHLYHELLARTLFFKPYHEEFEAEAVRLYIDRIFTGKPFLITEKHLGYLTREDTLYQPPHFFLTTTERLAQLSIVGLRNSLFFWDGSDEYSVNREFLDSPVSEVLPKLFRDTVMVEIDLANGTDEEIAESLKAALPQWRKVRGIEPDVTEAIRFGYGTIKKIINYRLLPMIDILVWSKLYKVRISEDRLSRLLYTDDDDEINTRLNHQIRDTDKPLALKAASIPFIRQFNLFINKNSHLKKIRVSDVMKIADSD
ncbi:DUF6387 family protein [Escherichia coli]|uniref:Uncharacterized protein n=8 Tax=Enterobacteriaceae TaxID=543 RepID=A0A9Q6ZAT5_ECO57|nr:DUF6387 family protein [Escherichia coli]NP_311541.1 hypothetical protein ECs_3514 [Escherichia coli O157:H7 str. Sakai]EET3530210.1 hypothetical protein [Escherichia coli O157:NM]EFW4743665.1 hypothetical protein [Shigella sonnei]EFW8300911.1 hypothetical protein [Shigella flexneri]EHU56629.1 hypothetical protein ECDEC3B_3672 [Escherichia coli DEC3B]EHU68241.1 hypothetical protein ECDEC3C_3947 [Escherichia coli DEC3C]EHU73046.1 hypothetical protein ECDEC3D_3650 [Escherichia coli DEC3D]E